eukprot:NODE_101_length_19951_cov_0.932501.p2 type:complete len:522 gc:universal NODE_101_length_19951_cov_0.932501:13362-14927(+)
MSNPLQLFENGAQEERGEEARLSIFVAAAAIGDLIKSTLGPKGMDKILQSGSSMQVTNDGATILKSVMIDNPAAKLLVNLAQAQDDEVGDGTTSVTVLASELLRQAEKLVDQRIHPQIIVQGYRLASQHAIKALQAKKKTLVEADLREYLIKIAKTTLSSKVLNQDKDYFAKMVVDAVLRLKGKGDLNLIQIIKKMGGKLQDSYLDDGFILDKSISVNSPKEMTDCKILIANTPMDTDKIKVFGARVKADSTQQLADLERVEKEKMKTKVEKIKAHGVNVFVNRQLIYNYPEQLLGDAGVLVIEHADFDGVERLALVTGGEIASTFDHPELCQLGKCGKIEQVMIGEDKLIKFTGVVGEACSIVLRGATNQLLDEAERSIHDALCVLTQTVKYPETVYGGGCSEVLMAEAVDELARSTPGKVSFAITAFADALRSLPRTIAENAGLDGNDLLSKLQTAHVNGQTNFGINVYSNEVSSMDALGIVECFKAKKCVVVNASEAAEMLLRVDDVVKRAPRQRERH